MPGEKEGQKGKKNKKISIHCSHMLGMKMPGPWPTRQSVPRGFSRSQNASKCHSGRFLVDSFAPGQNSISIRSAPKISMVIVYRIRLNKSKFDVFQ